jgi:hypothetical protein
MDQNIVYLDLDLGIVKTSHHAQFNKAWYLQPTRPPAAQLPYDLGLKNNDAEEIPSHNVNPGLLVPWPPTVPKSKWPLTPPLCRMQPLPLRETGLPRPITAAAARTSVPTGMTLDSTISNLPATPSEHLVGPKLSTTLGIPHFPPAASRVHTTTPSDTVSEYLIGQRDMSTFYMSPDPFFDAFDEVIDL